MTARIHVFSSTSVLTPSLVFPAVGWNATFRPSCSGNCFARASRRAFGSREKGICRIVASRLGGTTVIFVMFIDGVLPGVDPLDGEATRGRLFLFSAPRNVS